MEWPFEANSLFHFFLYFCPLMNYLVRNHLKLPRQLKFRKSPMCMIEGFWQQIINGFYQSCTYIFSCLIRVMGSWGGLEKLFQQVMKQIKKSPHEITAGNTFLLMKYYTRAITQVALHQLYYIIYQSTRFDLFEFLPQFDCL